MHLDVSYRKEHTFSKPALRVTEWVFLIGGLVLLVYLWRELGVTTGVTNLRLVGWGIAPIVLQECLAHLANTLGWPAAFPRPRPAIRFSHLFAARIAGDAVNYVTPTASFFVGWALGALEIYLILGFLGGPATVHRALTIEVLSVAIDGLFFFVPAKVGPQEGGKVVIFTIRGSTLPWGWRQVSCAAFVN